jgi:hypothetical protein
MQLDVINVLMAGEEAFGKPIDSIHAADAPTGSEWELRGDVAYVKSGVV